MSRFAELDRERGSAVISFVFLVPIMVMFLQLIVLGGRLASTTADIQSAAHEAARQASLARGPGTADDVIRPIVDTALANKGVQCQSRWVILTPATNFVAGGVVEVSVTCAVALSDLDLLQMPGSVTVTRLAREPIERYRVIE